MSWALWREIYEKRNENENLIKPYLRKIIWWDIRLNINRRVGLDRLKMTARVSREKVMRGIKINKREEKSVPSVCSCLGLLDWLNWLIDWMTRCEWCVWRRVPVPVRGRGSCCCCCCCCLEPNRTGPPSRPTPRPAGWCWTESARSCVSSWCPSLRTQLPRHTPRLSAIFFHQCWKIN